MRWLMRCLALMILSGLAAGAAPGQPQRPEPVRARTHNDRFTVPEYATAEEWKRRAAWLREHILASAGLQPMPERTPLRAQVFDERRRDRYSIFKVYFESLPGFYVTGNLYRPTGSGPFPAILSPHGHWTYGRLENTDVNSVPARAINLALQGFVVFTFDMIGYNDSRQLPHDFGGKREYLWGLSLAGLQLWNGIRGIDFLQSLAYVDGGRIGATGESGGGTQTFLLSAVDERIKVSAPVNMISLHMQGGCICENQPGLRLDTNNVELAATIAPRPLLMVSATGDWTKETLQVEYPAMRRLYALAGAETRVHAVQFDAEHNYNKDSREAMYAWMARWLKDAPAGERIPEAPFRIEGVRGQSLQELLVFYGRPMPDGALTRDQLVEGWIAAARRQVKESDPGTLQSALLHALALERGGPASASRLRRAPASAAGLRREPASASRLRREPASASRLRRGKKVVLMAGEDAALQAAIDRAGFLVLRVPETPFDAEASAKVQHFDTYNRTAASQRVADIVQAVDSNPGAMLVATGDAALAAIFALAVVPVEQAVLDVAQFDNSSDAAFVERLYMPGLRRAGDLQTAVSMTTGPVVIHNSGGRLSLDGPRVEARKLTPAEIVALLKQPGRRLSSRASQAGR